MAVCAFITGNTLSVVAPRGTPLSLAQPWSSWRSFPHLLFEPWGIVCEWWWGWGLDGLAGQQAALSDCRKAVAIRGRWTGLCEAAASETLMWGRGRGLLPLGSLQALWCIPMPVGAHSVCILRGNFGSNFPASAVASTCQMAVLL